MFSGPIVTSVLIWFFNYRQLFFFIMLFPFSALIVLRKLASKQAVKGDDPQRMYGDETSKLEIAKQFVTLLRRKRVVVVVTVTLLFFICDGFFRTLFPIYGQEVLLFSPSAISILFAFFGGVNASVRIPSGRLSDTIGRKRPLLLSVGICTLAFAIFAQATQFSLLVLGMMAYGFAWGMRVPPSSALLADCVEPHELSIAIAYLWMSADLGFSIGAALAGSLGSAIPFPLIIQSSVILFVVSLILISIGFRDMR
jgi:predicted MFS family arabinose efflux permease